MFPTLVLPTLVELIDANVLFSSTDSLADRVQKFRAKIVEELAHYPEAETAGEFQLLYAGRDSGPAKYPKFRCFKFTWKIGTKHKLEELALPDRSGVIDIIGSGKTEFLSQYQNLQGGRNHDTSRNVFHALVLALERKQNQTYGGAPQLVGVYRRPKSGGFAFGIVSRRIRYYNGMRVSSVGDLNIFEWRNRNFELCDGKIGRRMREAQIQPIEEAANYGNSPSP